MTDIVLVDDDELYREVLSADLADRGFAVSCFADGPSFLEAVSRVGTVLELVRSGVAALERGHRVLAVPVV